MEVLVDGRTKHFPSQDGVRGLVPTDTELRPGSCIGHNGNGDDGQVARYVSLHHHSTFSYGDGYGQPSEHVDRAVEMEQSALALTEHGNVTSHVKLDKAARAAGIKPIFGVEAYTGAVDLDNRSRFKWHLTILAQDQEGYRNLLRLVSKGWEEGFYYEPTISGEMLAAHQEGLIVLSGCSGSKLACDLLGGKGVEPHDPDAQAALDTVQAFRSLLGDRYYLEVQQFPELDRTKRMNVAYEWLSDKTGIPLVATSDVHYPYPQDNEMQLILHAIDRGGKDASVEQQARSWGYDVLLTNHDDRTMLDRMLATGLDKRSAVQALRATGEIAERCTVNLPKLKELTYPGKKPAEERLRAWCRKGWKYRGWDKLPKYERQKRAEQCKFELDLIVQKGFCDYFLVVSDIVKYAKDSGVAVGPARGSAAASVVCYLLRITEVDPIPFPNLLFARFIDINRHDLPDIDLDFDDELRWRVRDYAVRKYGEERVGNIGTFTKYKGKNSLIDVARVHRVPMGAVEGIKSKLIERSSGDLRAAATIEDTMEMFPEVQGIFDQYPALYKAQRLEGNVKGFSVHAAGLVVANEPLTNSCAVYTRRDKDGNVIGNVLSIDKWDAEYINALKIDVLGLKTMGAIALTLDYIGMTLEELYALPLDDPEVFAGFRRNEVVGLFQFDGRAMRSVNREVKPDNFAEVCDINALARPGPLHSGAAAEYIMAKHGKKKAVKLHPVLTRITAHTQGQVVYQEQILQTVRELGGFTWEEAARIRKIISKKEGEQEFNRQQGKFVKGCRNRGVKLDTALRIWKQLVTAGAYAFNAAHCVSYGMLAYWTMWLKQHHPLEFYCAGLIKFDPKTKGFDMLREAIEKGIKVLPPHPELSGESWTYDKEANALRAGLVQVKGIGPSMAPRILAWRESAAQLQLEGGLTWKDYEAVTGVGPKTVEAIEEFCAHPDPFGVYTLPKALKRVRAWLRGPGSDLHSLPIPTSRSDDIPYEAIRGNHVWVGFVRDRNLKDIYELHRSRTGEELDPKTVREPQHVNYVVILGEDETGPLTITVHRWKGLYERYKDTIWNMDVERDLLLVRGYKRSEYRRAIYATDLWVIKGEQ